MDNLQFTPQQARVLAALVEKSITTPQYYPLTVNALRTAANQKNAREPVMNLEEGEVGAALLALAEMGFVARDDAGGRVPRWRHRFGHQLLIKAPVLAVLAALMLRGPQTLAELRANAQNMGGPETSEGVQDALNLLADRAQPLVAALARQTGQSAQRFAHLLCGAAEAALPVEATLQAAAESGARAATPSRLEALEARVAELEQRLAQLSAALGEG
ncbi:MAG: DUF480 domain-containing protein [Nevskiaceae bacterium]|nr:MAG: DUF480 domain-containing protein [Nevskiaceae bacterium]TBR72508.1 MAG: DUF480 domain-containing protein [Nevskiaceae bacterium]